MNTLLKILGSLVCLYILVAKTFALLFYLNRHNYDIPLLLANCLVICICIYTIFVFWRGKTNIKFKAIWCILIAGSLFIQIYSGLFDYLTRTPAVNPQKLFWIYDLPNLLTVFLLLVSLLYIMKHLKTKSTGMSKKED